MHRLLKEHFISMAIYELSEWYKGHMYKKILLMPISYFSTIPELTRKKDDVFSFFFVLPLYNIK